MSSLNNRRQFFAVVFAATGVFTTARPTVAVDVSKWPKDIPPCDQESHKQEFDALVTREHPNGYTTAVTTVGRTHVVWCRHRAREEWTPNAYFVGAKETV